MSMVYVVLLRGGALWGIYGSARCAHLSVETSDVDEPFCDSLDDVYLYRVPVWRQPTVDGFESQEEQYLHRWQWAYGFRAELHQDGEWVDGSSLDDDLTTPWAQVFPPGRGWIAANGRAVGTSTRSYEDAQRRARRALAAVKP